MNSDDVDTAIACPTTVAMLKGTPMIEVKDDEIQVVAQAIADAHHRKPGADASGRLDDARTIIAAIDALVRHRQADASTKSAKASKASSDTSGTRPDTSTDGEDTSPDTSNAPGHVIQMAAKGKKRSKDAADTSA